MKNVRTLGNLGRFAIGALLASSLFACSALLGLTDPTTDNTIGGDGGTSSDVTSTTDSPIVTTNDGSTLDAAVTCDAAGIETDPLNCGSCGHSCLGGACTAKQCQPVLVDDDGTNTSPYDLSIDDGVIFFTNASDFAPHSVRSIDKTFVQKGIGASSLLVGLNETPYEIAANGASVYFAGYGGSDNGGKIEKCATGNCTTPVMIGGFDAYALATDGTNVVYGEKFTPDDGGDAIFTVKKTTTALGAATTMMTFASEIFWIKIVSGVVYVAVDEFDAPGGVFSCPIAGCVGSPTQLSNVEPNELYVANDTVYFTSAPDEASDKDGTVRSVKTDGSNPLTLATGLVIPLGIIADANYVYFSDVGDIDNSGVGKLLRCPLTGCGTNNALAVDFNLALAGNPQGLVDDGTAIYWGDYNGKIYKLAK